MKPMYLYEVAKLVLANVGLDRSLKTSVFVALALWTKTGTVPK